MPVYDAVRLFLRRDRLYNFRALMGPRTQAAEVETDLDPPAARRYN